MLYVYVPGKLLAISILSFGNDVNEVSSEHKRHSLPPYSKLALKVPQKVTKVNVSQL